MKKILFTILNMMFLCQNFLNAQTIEWGISPTYNISSFDYKNNVQFSTSVISPVISHNSGLMAFVGINTSSAFQFRLLTHLHLKKIQFENTYHPRLIGTMTYRFVGYDLGVLARYKLDVKKWKVAPGLGFFLSHNDFFFWSATSNVSNGTTNGINPWSLENYTAELPLSTGALGTLEVIPPFSLMNRQITFQASCWYALKDFFDEPLELPSNIETIVVEGKYHQLSLSLNFYFNRIKT
jgi:hypothetical protein